MAFLLLGAPVANTLHHVLVRHIVCAIHGDLIHPGEAHSAVQTSPEDAGRPVARDDGTRSSHGHDDCTISVISGDRALEASRSDALRVLAASTCASYEASLAAEPVIRARLYLIAPKNSPPVTRA